METGTRASGSDDLSMATELTFLPMAMCMWGSTKTANLKAMGSTPGAMVVTMWESLEAASNMARANGAEAKITTLINMKENTKMIKRTVTGNLPGHLGMCTREDIKMMKEKAMAK